MARTLKRPTYGFTRRALKMGFAGSGAAFFLLLGCGLFGDEQLAARAATLAPLFLPTIAAVLLGTLGIHRFAGAMDYRSQAMAPVDPETEGG